MACGRERATLIHLQLSDTPVTYSALTAEVDALVRRETAVIARKKDKLRSRGQVISGPAGEAEKQDSWLGSFVGNLIASLAI